MKKIKRENDSFEKSKDREGKSARRQNKEARREFLEDNNYAEVETDQFSQECAAEIQNFDIATHDAWIVQCSKGMDISELVNKRIKMPGRRYVGDFRVRTTKYTEPLDQSVGYVNPKGKYALRRVPLSGHIVVSKRLNMPKPEAAKTNEEASGLFPEKVGPQKLMLPVRHPFFGRAYKKRIELSKKTTKQLRKADEKWSQAQQRTKGNFYKIRSRLQATTQTLQQKEHEVRQSVLTGIAPTFMLNSIHPDYEHLDNNKAASEAAAEVDLTDRQQKPAKLKKRKNGAVNSHEPVVIVSDGDERVENGHAEKTAPPVKKHKKHKVK